MLAAKLRLPDTRLVIDELHDFQAHSLLVLPNNQKWLTSLLAAFLFLCELWIPRL